MTLDTILFDLDGTLVDTADDLAASLNATLAHFGRPPVPPPSVRAMVGQGARRLIEHGLGVSGDAADAMVAEGLPVFLAHYGANIAVHSRPYAGAEATLDRLAARGFRLAICTNKPEALARSLLSALGWTTRFDALLGADSRPWRKPDPRHLFDTMAAAGGTSAVHVGDSITDARAAQAAGMPLVLMTHGYSVEPVATLGADALIDGFDGLEAAIERIQGRFTAPGSGGWA